MKKLSLLSAILSVYLISSAQTWQDTVTLIETAFDRYKPGNPGCQLAIARNGQVILSRSWGMSDLEHNAVLTNESILEAGSVSKQFTAAAILLLEQQGKLSLNDDVRKYVPELPVYESPVILRQMMQHTSGLKDWGSIADIAGWPRSTKTYSNDDALYIVSRQKTLNFKPGDEYLYSNSNYNLFAIIVERVSGMSLAEFTRIHVFEPAGTKHTEWRNDFKKIVPRRAIAYGKNETEYYTEMPNEYVYGNGGLLTTSEDLLAWNNFYLNGKLGTPSLLPKQLSTTPLNNGFMNTYGAGLVINAVNGWKCISHNGATASYRSSLEYYPELGLSIAWLSNTSEFDRGPEAASIIRNVLVKNINPAAKKNETKGFDVSAEKLNSYTGWYRDPRTAVGVKLFIKDGKLNSSWGINIAPVSENVFSLGTNKMEMQTDNKRSFVAIFPSSKVYYSGADSATLDEKTMKEYTGEYYSEEAEVRFYVQIKDGKLIGHRDPKTDIPFSPTYKDGFAAGPVNVFFERDKRSHITTMKVFVGRARNVVFKKIK